ncbi:hydroxypyruvate isomerase [Desulfosediminicola flagellatus]|uniref:hydroxypyruvate isomerase n=1 Tax=Desulfosediminicola flagellatus TaxID=2569541 RepID=UPI0010AC78EA|nr:hydroxypyruvate isomerase [Desulfosediminicola flagellatus]
MPIFNANLSMMFQEVDFLDRFEAAAKAGFKGVEYLFPYDFEINQLLEILKKNNLKQVLHNLPAGDWGAGERGIAILPDRVGEFQEGVGRAIEYAKILGNTQVNMLSGIAPEGVSSDLLNNTFIDNVTFAASELEKNDIHLLIEPVNTRDIPGFFLCGTQQALDVITAAGSDNIQLQYDIYHMQIMEGNLAPTMEKHISSIGHIQLADNPGRHEPGTGEINYPFLFDFLDRIGYAGWIGCEYIPATTTEAGLGWLEQYK